MNAGSPTSMRELPLFAMSAPPANNSLLAAILREQQTLTAVEEFTRFHESAAPTQAKHYAKLLPASPPGPGQQYAFEVDLDRCSGCKACVVACHSLNGLDDNETWRDVGLLIGGTAHNPLMQHVTTACHHCVQPACMIACPVDAYEKDPETGIVKHLDDQCFGCQYCTLACPYDVPKYHADKGIVRKCDMCSDRLKVGEAPACVQACPHEAIAIRIVDIAQVIENAEVDDFLPAAPEPHITLPTTTYKTTRVFPRNTLPADYHAVNPQQPHLPLIVMLVLTQMSVGAFVVGLFLEHSLPPELTVSFRRCHATMALFLGLSALAASTLHLGRPLYAFRAVIGLRHSWLSREIVAFGLFAGAATLYAGATWLTGISGMWLTFLARATAVFGAIGLFCSIMIYVFTQRKFWSLRRVSTLFVGTAVVLGIAATWLTVLIQSMLGVTTVSAAVGSQLAKALMLAATVKLVYEGLLFHRLADRRRASLKRSALLMIGPLSNITLARFACGILGGVAMPALQTNVLRDSTTEPLPQTIIVALLVIACVAGELLERYLFFAAVATERMPGAIRK